MKSETKVNLAKLAALAGVSTSTASRALKDNPLIKQETRERIQALARQYNFRVNEAASRLRTQKTHVVAVILNLIEHTEQSITDPFLLKIVGDLNQALNAYGYELLLSNSFMATDDWADYFISSQRADGLLIVGQGTSTRKIEAAAASGVPLVVWGDACQAVDYPIVGGNNQLGGRQATAHLLAQGRKRILFLGDTHHSEMDARYAGYVEAHRDAGIVVDAGLLAPIDITSKAAHHYVSERVRTQGLDFDGIFAVSDMLAFGALKALKERYIAVPGEVSLVGYDDIPLAELMHPSLTTVRQNTQLAAQAMVEELLNQFNGRPATSRVIDIELLVRRSSVV